MGCNRRSKAFEIIAAFEHRDDAAGDPGVVAFNEVETAERIAPMAIEPSRENNDAGAEISNARQNQRLKRLAEALAAVSRRQRRIDDIPMFAALVLRARSGKERHLMC